ncbi:MAG: alpha-galactosidase [Actinomycetes bacterium]
MTSAAPDPQVVVLRGGGACAVVDVTDGPPRLLWWGADLPDLPNDAAGLLAVVTPPVPRSAFDVVPRVSVAAVGADGWSGRPAVLGDRDGGPGSPRFLRSRVVEHATAGSGPRDGRGAAGDRVVVEAVDDHARLRLRTEVALDEHGVLQVRQSLTNDGETPYDVQRLATLLPVPDRAGELLDLTGRWCRERAPQRRPFLDGALLRETHHGRSGHDAPLLLVAGTPGFGFGEGELWSVTVAWSGDLELWAERLPTGHSVLAGGEQLAPGEVRLAPGETYTAPAVLGVWSDAGLDGLSDRLHRRLRARETHPASPRPVVLNTWEAVYFDHNLERLRELARTAARIGVERFVLDDGWFRHRRDDRAGLGDWYVDEGVWPQGLTPLIDEVRSLGMQFGLWVEPEMVNLDSDLVRAHPEWVLGQRVDEGQRRHALPWRGQQVLDLSQRGAWEYLLERLDALLSDNDIAYLKWDHNRDLTDAGSRPGSGVHQQTLALYALLDELRRRHPGVEIESCASGGGRVDLGILDRTDRVWASDTNDALERQAIQRWTQLLVPPELVGSHIGPPTAHTTGRTHRLSLRAATALFGHAGLEWDITTCDEAELDALAQWTATYKRLRGVLHTGRVVRADRRDESTWVHGVVAQDRSHAVFAAVAMGTSNAAVRGAAVLPGLDPRRRYRVQLLEPVGPPLTVESAPPPWLRAAGDEGLVIPGAVLTEVGLQLPVLAPEDALLLECTATDT